MRFYQLMLVTQAHQQSIDDYVSFIETCAISGVTSVQIREKNLSFNDALEFGMRLKPVLKRYGVALIVNDSLALAQALDADGIHLGQTDGCPIKARALLGKDKWIGVSVDSMEDLTRANLAPIDYVGVGAVFPTKHKANVARVWGVSGLKDMVSYSQHPVVAIGGIDLSNAELVAQTGCHGLAAIGAFHETPHPAKTVQQLSNIIRNCHDR